MSPIKKNESILQTAISKEEMTRSFYIKVTEKVSNPSFKEPLQQMAQEEQEITTHDHALVVIRTAMQLEDEAIDFEEGHRSWLEKEHIRT